MNKEYLDNISRRVWEEMRPDRDRIRNKLCYALQAYRYKNNMSKKDMAKKFNINPTTYSKW